ncbi:MAG: FIST N-terminal domain-containing protein [Terrimicrobiaceae bacterium]|nr:FIST N-terminal domain-containing protein [Terrimicrobiaceae bacterium]
MPSESVSILHEGPYEAAAVQHAAGRIRAELNGPATIAFAFVTPDYLPDLEEFADTIRVDGHVLELVGCTGSGLTFDAIEREGGSGFSILALRTENTRIAIHALPTTLVESADGPKFWKQRFAPAEGWLVLTNPFGFAVDDWLVDWNAAFPGVPTVGGLASGGRQAESMGVFHNGRVIDGGIAVGLSGTVRLVPVVSQGCRPIGEPLPVTKAEDNIIFALGSRPAYQALESAFQSLSESERSHAQGNLFAGIAGTEYLEDFRPGDFVIRNIIGADPDSGAVVIAGIPRVGQTVQYQLRDRQSADNDLRRVLRVAAADGRRPVASLLFCCTGRGSSFFGVAGHDAGMLEEVFGRHSSAGLFCNGEIGPVAGRNCVHGYTAACAIFVET